MNPEPDWPIELSPADIDAVSGPDGAVAAAVAWVEMVLDGRLADAWGSTSALFRLTLTRHWSWQHRFALHRAGLDALHVAGALAGEDGPAHPLWPMFAGGQRLPESALPSHRLGWVAAGPPEPVGPDLEVVRLASDVVACTGHPAPPLMLTLQLGPTGWLVTGHGCLPKEPGWPPGQKA